MILFFECPFWSLEFSFFHIRFSKNCISGWLLLFLIYWFAFLPT